MELADTAKESFEKKGMMAAKNESRQSPMRYEFVQRSNTKPKQRTVKCKRK